MRLFIMIPSQFSGIKKDASIFLIAYFTCDAFYQVAFEIETRIVDR